MKLDIFTFQVLQYLQKSHRCVVQDVNWQVDLDRCKEVATQSTELADSKSDVISIHVPHKDGILAYIVIYWLCELLPLLGVYYPQSSIKNK